MLPMGEDCIRRLLFSLIQNMQHAKHPFVLLSGVVEFKKKKFFVIPLFIHPPSSTHHPHVNSRVLRDDVTLFMCLKA